MGLFLPIRRRSLLVLTAVEREDISRGLASGSSIREIAKALERAASTVSREVARHGGRAEYRAQEADASLGIGLAAERLPSGHSREVPEAGCE